MPPGHFERHARYRAFTALNLLGVTMATSRGAVLARSIVAIAAFALAACDQSEPVATGVKDSRLEAPAAMNPSLVADGRQIFRFETFGNETFWSDTAALHVKVNALKPIDALNVGLMNPDASTKDRRGAASARRV